MTREAEIYEDRESKYGNHIVLHTLIYAVKKLLLAYHKLSGNVMPDAWYAELDLFVTKLCRMMWNPLAEDEKGDLPNVDLRGYLTMMEEIARKLIADIVGNGKDEPVINDKDETGDNTFV